MPWIILGCLSFAPLYLFDRLKAEGRGRPAAPLFPLGCLGILASTIGAFFSGDPRFVLPVGLWVICLVLAAASFLMLLWALFFALPFSRTYVRGAGGDVVDTGLYAMCRHPGVLFFFGLYLWVWLLSGRDAMLICAVVLSACDVLHVWVQDRYYFPKTIRGYDGYRRRVPFLIPTAASLGRCARTLTGKEANRL